MKIYLAILIVFASACNNLNGVTKTTSNGVSAITPSLSTSNPPATPESCFEFDGQAITRYTCSQIKDVVFPSTIDGKAVKTIGESLMASLKLNSVTIPEGVVTIEKFAFASNGLTSVVLPNSLISIEQEAFEFNNLTSIGIPSGVTNIGVKAFAANRLTSVELPPSLTVIYDYAFADNRLTSVTIPNGVTIINEGAFTENLLTSVQIPKTVTHIYNYAFEFNNLSRVEIPEGVSRVDASAFQNNYLTYIKLPTTLTWIGMQAFSYNDLKIAYVPESANVMVYGSSDTFDSWTKVIVGQVGPAQTFSGCDTTAEQSPVGTSCNSSLGVTFVRVNGGWKDTGPNGKTWFDGMAIGIALNAGTANCISIGQTLPSIQDFSIAESHGFREILKDMKQRDIDFSDMCFWSSSPGPVSDEVACFDGTNGQNSYKPIVDNDTSVARCVNI